MNFSSPSSGTQGPVVRFSGLVIAFNEAQLLEDCLRSLAFCEDIVVVDLGSIDDTKEVADRHGARVFPHPWVPIGELAKPFGISQTKNDWVIVIDPDERVGADYAAQAQRVIGEHPQVGIIFAPWRFYFFGKELTTTRWGMPKIKPVAFNRHRVDFPTLVNSPNLLREGFQEHRLPPLGDNSLVHLWVTNYANLFSKHWKYVKMEGEAQYTWGRRFKPGSLIKEPARHLKMNLFDYHGLNGGWPGIFLSFFWTAYVLGKEISLGIYQWRQR